MTDRPTCTATTKTGKPCRNLAEIGGTLCRVHDIDIAPVHPQVPGDFTTAEEARGWLVVHLEQERPRGHGKTGTQSGRPIRNQTLDHLRHWHLEEHAP